MIPFSLVEGAAARKTPPPRPFQSELTKGSIRSFVDEIFPLAGLDQLIEAGLKDAAKYKDPRKALSVADLAIRRHQRVLKDDLLKRLAEKLAARDPI